MTRGGIFTKIRNKPRLCDGAADTSSNYTALSTLPERKHLVQAYTRHGVPFTIALTFLTLGFQVLLDLR